MTSIDWPTLINWIGEHFIEVILGFLSITFAFYLNIILERKKQQQKYNLEFERELQRRWGMPNGLPPATVTQAVQQAAREGHVIKPWKRGLTQADRATIAKIGLFFLVGVVVSWSMFSLYSYGYHATPHLTEIAIATQYQTSVTRIASGYVLTLTPSPTGFILSSTPLSVLTPTFPSISHAPFYVYKDWNSRLINFVPEGYLGDISFVKVNENYTLDPKRSSVVQITYRPGGSEGWAGVYWWSPGSRWGENNVGHDISFASKLTFWARGERGGEIAEFKVGGLPGQNGDSLGYPRSTGPIRLSSEWTQYTINLTGSDLSHVVGGFAWITSSLNNPTGSTIYIDDIMFEQ
jgi:hypothetical protein